MTALTILGIESSCDETAAAVVRGAADAPPGEILSSVVYDQTELHSAFGGVVPEIAARAHAEKLDVAVAEALRAAALSLADMDAIAVTAGPGLIGGLISGVSCAKGLALGAGKPLVGVNHLEGHALTARLTDGVAYPFLLLLVSGGHCQLLSVEAAGVYRRLGTTLDDAPGEAFDKTAKLMGLGFPGGPAVERKAEGGDAARFAFPRALIGRKGLDFSFSGLKTALRVKLDTLRAEGPVTEQDQADLCAGFQAACVEALTRVTGKAMTVFREAHPSVAAPVLAVAGGVAANQAVRAGLDSAAEAQGFTLVAPPLSLCTDNAAMIAWAGLERFAGGHTDGLSLAPRPRWPLDETSTPVAKYGKRGAKS
jgi:N6-L-threonylcarbamoyladenine synthase